MNWTLAENKYSRLLIIILFLLIYYVTEFLILNIINVNLDQVHILIRLVIAIPTIVLHELLHFIIAICVVANKGKIWIGVNLKKITVYTNVDGEYSYLFLIIYTVGPFIIMTILLGLLLYINKIYIPYLWIIVFYNSFMSVMDIRNTYFIIKNYNYKTKFKIEEYFLYYMES